MPIVEISPSLPTYYESSGTGPPVVFIHPPHMGHTVFKYQHELSDRFQVITYDIRGHGRSGVSDELMTIPRLANDLLAFLDALKIDQAVIVGYSSSGSIAQEFALSHPERVKALVLSGGFPEVTTFTLKRQFQFGMALLRSGQIELLSKLLAVSHKVTKEDKRELFHECLKAHPASAYDFYEKSMQYTCTERLQSLHCPLFLLYGQFSHIRPYLELYKQHVPQMKSVLVSKSLHQVPIKKYHSFNHALSIFLKYL
ncbi:alpha/beta fold hydrolase [Virgibacillus necropolis]|uniref:Hydrolase n=1 Tax=Virgibacillus necropolis TaxID=163877 RepID=A0A221MFZ5_9BACI|nr:alpha/beta hydrolase [Virgibacillus necropolis]ASN06555.1 hydrolase [Virgibacillus necropolis]